MILWTGPEWPRIVLALLAGAFIGESIIFFSVLTCLKRIGVALEQIISAIQEIADQREGKQE